MSKVFTIAEGLENLGALRTGGQGSVYKGRRTGVIYSAIKVMPTPILTENDKNYLNFQNEVAKLQRVNEIPNPNIVKILGSGLTESGSFPFIEMEFIEGPDLSDLLTPQQKVFTLSETLNVADQLASALAHCYRQGVKHGDLKSNNVKYNIHTGNYVLLDFGLAILTDEQRRTSLQNAGAVEFMAPEQHDGKILLQTDVYSYGIILYELLAGEVPFILTGNSSNNRNEVTLKHKEAPVPDLLAKRKANLPANWPEEKKANEMKVPKWMLKLVEKCLQKKPEDRYANGEKLYEELTTHQIKIGDAESLTFKEQEFIFKALELSDGISMEAYRSAINNGVNNDVLKSGIEALFDLVNYQNRNLNKLARELGYISEFENLDNKSLILKLKNDSKKIADKQELPTLNLEECRLIELAIYCFDGMPTFDRNSKINADDIKKKIKELSDSIHSQHLHLNVFAHVYGLSGSKSVGIVKLLNIMKDKWPREYNVQVSRFVYYSLIVSFCLLIAICSYSLLLYYNNSFILTIHKGLLSFLSLRTADGGSILWYGIYVIFLGLLLHPFVLFIKDRFSKKK